MGSGAKEPRGSVLERKLIFVSGPVSSDPYGCIPRAIGVFDKLWDEGWCPILPQLSVFQNMFSEHDYEEWMEYFDTIIAKCDAMYCIPGESSGRDREIKRARELGLPICHEVETIHGIEWEWEHPAS